MDCPLQGGEELLPQAEEFQYPRALFTTEGKMEVDRQIGAPSAIVCGEGIAEAEGGLLHLVISLFHLLMGCG